MNLHPELQFLIASTWQRFQILAWVRLVLNGAIVLTGFLLILVPLDAWLLFDEPDRLASAIAMYAAIAFVAWSQARRGISSKPNNKRVAHLIGERAPDLRDPVLSAVELSEENGRKTDSAELRQIVQLRSAQAAKGITAAALLPWGLLNRELAIALGVLFLLAGGFVVDGARFGARCLRLVLPLANIERPSDVLISIVSPKEAAEFVPSHEKVTVITDISSPKRVDATLQFSVAGAPLVIRPMRTDGAGRYTSEIPIGGERMEYQIKAGSGLSKRMRLTPKERPHVVEFKRTYYAPSYSNLAERLDISADGRLSGLKDSWVELVLKSNQPLQGGSIKTVCGDREEFFELNVSRKSPPIASVMLPLRGNGVYEVTLISLETGFSSHKNLQYNIQVEEDSPPNITLQTPENDLSLPMGRMLRLSGVVDDDLGIATVRQEFQLNNGSWKALPVASDPGRHFEIDSVWDPMDARPQQGDVVSIHFVATDTKGQRSVSRDLHVSLTPVDAPSPASRALANQSDSTASLEDVSRKANTAARALTEAKAESELPSPNMLKREQSLARAWEALEATFENVALARKSLLQRMRSADSAGTLELSRLQELALNQLEGTHLNAAHQFLQQLSQGVSDKKGDLIEREILRQANEAAIKAALMATTAKDAATSSESSLAAKVLKATATALAHEQASIQNSGPLSLVPGELEKETDAAASDTLRRQRVNLAGAKALEKELSRLSERAPTAGQQLASARNAIRDAIQKSERATVNVQGELAKGKDVVSSQKMLEAGGSLSKVLEATAQTLDSLDPSLAKEEDRTRRKLRNAISPVSEHLLELAGVVDLPKKPTALPQEVRATIGSVRLQAEATSLRENALTNSVGNQKAREHKLDMLTAAAAVEQLARDTEVGTDSANRIRSTAGALQILETAAALSEARALAEEISAAGLTPEEEAVLKSRDQRMRVNESLENLYPKILRSGLSSAAAKLVRDAQAALSTADPEGVNVAQGALSDAAQSIVEATRKARSELGALAPSISSRLETSAKDSAANADATSKLIAGGADDEQAAPLSNIKNEEKFSAEVEKLRKEMLAYANSQDSMTPEGRTLARDADDAAAILKSSSKALGFLKQANQSPSERTRALKAAAEQQQQAAAQLQKLAEHFRNIEAGEKTATEKSRESLRESERLAGVRERLEARDSTARDLGSLAETRPVEEQKQLVSNFLNRTKAEENKAQGDRPDSLGMDSKELLDKALNDLGRGDSSSAAAAISDAVSRQMRSERLDRNAAASSGGGSEGEAALKSSLASEGLNLKAPSSDSSAWGALPKRISDDLMRGSRESAPSEYRDSIEAYFRAVAEKARSATKRP